MNVPALLATYQLRQREYLLEITRAMTSRLELPSLLELILTSAANLVSCREGLIVLEREDFGPQTSSQSVPGEPEIEPYHFEIRAFYGIKEELLPAFHPLLDFTAMVPSHDENEEGQTVQVHLQQRVRQVEEKLGMSFGQVVGLPLLFENELLGFIYLFRGEHAFTELDTEFLLGFAYQAAIAVRNAKLYSQVETERSRLVTLVEKSSSGIMILDANRRVRVINQPLALMLDVDAKDTVGQPCRSVLSLDNVTGDDLCEIDNYIEVLTDEGMTCEGEINRPGRERIIVSITYSPLYSDDNPERRLVNIIVTVQDITRFREEEEIKNTFTSIISHELKTPVALIKGYAQTLARPDAEWDGKTARQGLEIIEEEADRLESLINNLLDASRIQAGGFKLDYAYVNLNALVNKVVDGYRLQTKNHQIEIDLPDDFPAVWGDSERLRQVLTNLIGNAIKYSPDGGSIRIGGWTDSESVNGKPRVALYVADEGIGIPQDELAHIFDRFYRVDTTLRRRTAGAGLGLFLCKAIIDAHQGQIWARAEPSNGTTFTFSLPIHADEDDEGQTTGWVIAN